MKESKISCHSLTALNKSATESSLILSTIKRLSSPKDPTLPH